MNEPLTEELLKELLASPDPAAFADSHDIGARNVPDNLQQLLDEKGAVRIDIIHKAGLNETFGYQIFVGQRNASRNKLLQIAFALGCTLRETNRLLHAGGVSQLYCKNRRDAIMIFCIDRGYTLMRANEELYRFGEDTIC
ncbi:MAG: XRE family transcriptional regulator [Coriobacteriia bacterium]|nr:XRE family transcriptional regulator [Coriobacteriia bacterium]